jgi:glucuronokinase
VLALTLPQLQATVTAGAGPPRDESMLLRAARARFGGSEQPALHVTTNIPREVGLAGSSAIVTGALRALAEWHDVELEPLQLARMALEAENSWLGIEAGPQDRVAQAIGGLVFMDFAGEDWHAERLDAALPPMYVAWLTDAAAPSHDWHAALRPDPAEMQTLAGLARSARDALVEGDHARFAACVDGSLDARARMATLDPRHVALADAARGLGACANFTGSGGAIVGVLPDAAFPERLRAAAGCEVLTV